MHLRYLFGPVGRRFAEQNLSRARQSGHCLAFNAEGDLDLTVRSDDTWEAVAARLPDGWVPDFVALYLPYAVLPECLVDAPARSVAIAADWGLLWHPYRERLREVDLVFSDAEGAAALGRAGIDRARILDFGGCGADSFPVTPPDEPRDIDLLVVGNLNPAVHPERAAWLAPLARLGEAWNVVFHPGPLDGSHLPLLRRARVVVHQGRPGCVDPLPAEATAAGALVLSDDEGGRAGRRIGMGNTSADAEAQVRRYLRDEGERRSLVEAAQRDGVPRFEDAWEEALARASEDLCLPRKDRSPPAGAQRLLTRSWQAAVAAGRPDPGLVRDLESAVREEPSAPLLNALGAALMRQASNQPAAATAAAETASEHFRRAVALEPVHAVARLNLLESLRAAGQRDEAAKEARRAQGLLAREGGETLRGFDSVLAKADFGSFHVEWERAGWETAGRPEEEAVAKARLLRWHFQSVLAQLTGELVHHYEAAFARPDLPPVGSLLGGQLREAGYPVEALPHLRRAVDRNPFDREAARSLASALADAGDVPARLRLARERRLLRRAMPHILPAEKWFEEAAPTGTELVSIVILCCNQLECTRLCLESLLRHTRAPYELVLVDNGSSDGTAEYLEAIRSHPGPERVEVVRNKTNRGFPAGCNQALARARGRFVLFLNNDVVVTAEWLDGMVAALLRGWPAAGMVGAVTNNAPDAQRVPVDYEGLDGLDRYAERRRREFAGRTLAAQRATGFCLLARRDVLDRAGQFDERFGLGFFDDDDLCVRVRKAGFQIVIALDVFVHHFGNRTFRGLGLDVRERLIHNFGLFREKWGDEHAAGYRLMDGPPDGSDLVSQLPGRPRIELPPDSPPSAPAEPRRRPRKTLSMIVKNEEPRLPKCLGTAADLFDEVVVVDTGSSDRTREVAARFGARVFDFPWCDSFAAARNESLRHATGDWVLWLDGDDQLDDENRRRLRELLAGLGDEPDAYAMKVRSGLDPARSSFRVLDQVRLFPNRPGVRWDYRVHEQILPAVRRLGGGVRWADIVIDHTGYQDPSARQGKLARNLNLLRLDYAERPDDPVTRFNLGWTTLDLGQTEEAVRHLRRSLELSTPDSSIVRKLYDLLTHAHRQSGSREKALAWCEKGLAAYPEDGELLLQKALLLREAGDVPGAQGCLERLLEARPGRYFASVDAGLRGYKTRHLLAELYSAHGRASEAEVQWRAAVAEKPDFGPAWVALGELMLTQKRWPAAERVVEGLRGARTDPVNPDLLQARLLLARQDFAAAKQHLRGLIARHPESLGPRVLMTHALLQEGQDWDAAERALRDVLALAPNHAEARRNLEVLLAQRGRSSTANTGPLPAIPTGRQ